MGEADRNGADKNMLIHIPIKPLSVNQAWQGRRFKTDAYKSYARSVHIMLPKGIKIPDGKLQVTFRFYVSNVRADYDNPVKPLQDIIFKHYGVDDSRIFRGIVEKVIVQKGQEKTEVEIEAM